MILNYDLLYKIYKTNQSIVLYIKYIYCKLLAYDKENFVNVICKL